MAQELDTSNRFMVSAAGPNISIMRTPTTITRDDALNLAAWLVAMADREDKFPALLDAVQNT